MQYINIITRTSDRRKHFERCLYSIKEQTYDKAYINHIVIADTYSSVVYVRENGIEPFFIDKKTIKPEKHIPNGHRQLNHNLYFNKIGQELIEDWIIYLDDDDYFIDNQSIERLMNKVNDKDTFYTFKVKIGNEYIPRKIQADNKPVLNDFSGSGMIFHTDYWDNDLWVGYSGSDYHCGLLLWNRIPNTQFLNQTIIEAPRANFGRRIE
jgi:glycosyltransferase involved in cell wall biosynthesis